ncbi:hypothetical protein [Peribacillus huizhouensis]|uniref:Septal ring factor EnvC (AmiA/AmiB activator) n=1 Tax=Peribacillus huizhouensis TaxID=1501239 RepID=A0ABR6CS56_9BACI|nr:hypothetical protein [Peribacillus huizhouensis]MBA9027848.1 septal ring factor EnvC (AmiA/AmiB activator) [Peribacillus huizhouensis]
MTINSLPFSEFLKEDDQTIYPFTTATPHNNHQQIERIEQIMGDLIRYIAKTQAKTSKNESHLTEIESRLNHFTMQYIYLSEQYAVLHQRLAMLENK